MNYFAIWTVMGCVCIPLSFILLGVHCVRDEEEYGPWFCAASYAFILGVLGPVLLVPVAFGALVSIGIALGHLLSWFNKKGEER